MNFKLANLISKVMVKTWSDVQYQLEILSCVFSPQIYPLCMLHLPKKKPLQLLMVLNWCEILMIF